MIDDRGLPNSLDFEAAVLCAALTESGIYERCDMLRPEHFLSDVHARVWAAIGRVVARGLVPDTVSVSDDLKRVGQLAAVGGDAFLYSLIVRIVPTSDAEVKARYLVSLAQRRNVTIAAESVAALGHDLSLETPAFLEYAATHIVAATKKAEPTGVFSSARRAVPREWMTKPPPPREHLLERDDAGWIPLGKVGILAGEGGSRKTMTLISLAVCVATGRPFFGCNVARPGRVALVLGEEDPDETQRRIHAVTVSLSLTEREIDLVHERIVCFPLAGEPIALVESDGRGNTAHTRALRDLSGVLSAPADEGWSLVVLDPLSRFAHPEAESDNAQATRFVQAVETLLRAPGNPTIVIAHHTSKSARASKDSTSNAVRGSSGLSDGGRFTLMLTKGTEGDLETVTLAMVKANYAAYGDPIVLTAGPEGTLRILDRGEADAYTTARESRQIDALCKRVLDEVSRGAYTSRTALRTALQCRNDTLAKAMAKLERDGLLRTSSKPYEVVR